MPTIDQKTINTLAGSDLSINTREEFAKLIQTLGGSAVKLSENSGGAYVDFSVIEKNAAALGLTKENVEVLRSVAGEVNNKSRNGSKLFLSVNDFMFNKSSPYAQGMSVEKQLKLFGIAAKKEGAAETIENGGQRPRIAEVKQQPIDNKPAIATIEKIQADTREAYRQGGIQLLTQAGVTIDPKATFETVKAKVAENEEVLAEFDDAETLDDLETLLNNGDKAINILKGDTSIPVDAGISDILIATKYSGFSEERLSEIADGVEAFIVSKGGSITVEDFNQKQDDLARSESSLGSNNFANVFANPTSKLAIADAVKTIKDSSIYKDDADLRANFANFEDGVGHIQETSILNRVLVALGKGTVDKEGAITIDKKYSGITTDSGNGITLPQILSKIDEIDNGAANLATPVQSTPSEAVKADLTLAKTPQQAVALAIFHGDSSYLNYTDAEGKKQTAFMDHDSFADKDGNISLDKMTYPKIGGYTALLKNTDIEQEAAENGKFILEAFKQLGKNPLDVPLFSAIQSQYGTLDARLVGYAVVVAQDYAQNGDGAIAKFDSGVVEKAYQYFNDPKDPFADINAQMVATSIRPTILSGIDTLLKRDQEVNGTPVPVKK